MNPTLNEIVYALRREACRRTDADWWMNILAFECSMANREHEASDRQFCHVGHRLFKICHARATERLALPWKLGLVVHEFGHLALCGPRMIQRRHTEADANHAGELVTGVKVQFKGPLVLEWADPRQWRRFCRKR